MGVNSLPKTVTRQRRSCDLNPGPSAPESSTLTTRLPSHPKDLTYQKSVKSVNFKVCRGMGIPWGSPWVWVWGGNGDRNSVLAAALLIFDRVIQTIKRWTLFGIQCI